MERAGGHGERERPSAGLFLRWFQWLVKPGARNPILVSDVGSKGPGA